MQKESFLELKIGIKINCSKLFQKWPATDHFQKEKNFKDQS